MNPDINDYIKNKREIINKKLKEYFPDDNDRESLLIKSINYSIHSGGKRLRPILCLASCELVSGKYNNAIPVACALEMIHTYSLVHDDLPCMDDDDLRRGKPTNHKVYGEALAVLAGDALLTDAFSLVIEESRKNKLSESMILDLVCNLSKYAGSEGMVLGQSIDLEIEGNKEINSGLIEKMHSLKTGKLIEASVISGAMAGGASDSQLARLGIYSKKIGLAYQISDDVLDILGSDDYGKNLGSDSKNKKPTYSSTEGIKKSLEKVNQLTDEAVKEINDINNNFNPLRDIAYYLSERINRKKDPARQSPG